MACRAVTGHARSPAGEMAMFCPSRYSPVLDFRRLKTMPSSVKLTEPLEISERNEVCSGSGD